MARDLNPVEGVDYIFDRYAFLGLPRDADKAAIQKAVRERRAENHPDRLVKAGAEVKAVAERTLERVNDAAAILLNDATRPLYDQALARFEAESPRLVSTDGSAIISLGRPRLDLEYMLQDAVFDTKDLEEKAAKLSGFSPRRLAAARRDHAAAPDDAEARAGLREELTAELVMLNLMEDFAWMRAGVDGTRSFADGPLTDAADYAAAVARQIAAIHDDLLPAAAEARHGAVLLGVAQPPLLLAGPGGSAEDATPASTALVVAEARRRFTLRAEDIRALAERKQAVLRDLVGLTETRALADDRGSGVWDLYLAVETDDGPVAMVAFRLDANTTALAGIDGFEPTPVADLEGREFAHGAMVVLHNGEITDLLIEIRHAAETLATAHTSAASGEAEAAEVDGQGAEGLAP